jgi:competence protein ComER
MGSIREEDMNTGFIGIGSMGGMLVRAFLRSGTLAPNEVWAANRSPAKLEALAAAFPSIHIADSREVAANCGLIFLCLSAPDTASVLAEMDAELSPSQLLLTIAAAIPLKILEDRVPCRAGKLIPSITQEIGAGIILLMYGSRITAEDRKMLEALLGNISQPVVITESQDRPAIGLASSGPALLAYLLQSMADEAVHNNPELSPQLANKLVQETATATMRLMSEARMTGEEIIHRVAVHGGMTELAIEILSRYVPKAWQTAFRETAERETKSRKSLVL